MVGEGAGTLVARLLAARSLDVPHSEALARYLAAYDRRLLGHTRPYDGIPEALDDIERFASLAVLTNKPTAATTRVLEGLDLGRRFQSVIGGDSPHGTKPAPGGLHAIMAAAGRGTARHRPRRRLGDRRAHRACGTRPLCMARYGFGYLTMPPDVLDGTELVVDRPADLPGVLASLRP